jgi:hypothetical protein
MFQRNPLHPYYVWKELKMEVENQRDFDSLYQNTRRHITRDRNLHVVCVRTSNLRSIVTVIAFLVA